MEMPSLLTALLPLVTAFVFLLGLGLCRLGEASLAPYRAIAASGLLAGFLACAYGIRHGDPLPIGTELLRQDWMSLSWQILFLMGAVPLVFFLRAASEMPLALVLGAVLGMSLMSMSNHLFLLFLGLEITSLSSVLLVFHLRPSRDSLQAAIKYFFTGALAASLYLIGMVIYYAATGSMALNRVEFSPPVALAQALMLSAALFKIGAFPMHFWLPDVYDASPPELVAFLSTTVKAAGFLMLMRLLPLLPQDSPGWLSCLPYVSVATMTLGNILALCEERVQRLLAYSSISHAGTLLSGIWAWSRRDFAPEAALTIYFYLAVYLFMNTGAFLFLRLSQVTRIRQLRGFAARSPALAGFFTLMLLSLASIPPTGGFLAKFFIFWDLLQSGGAILAGAVALNSLISLGYYFRLIKETVLESPCGDTVSAPAKALYARWALAVCAIPVVFLGAAPGIRAWFQYLLG